MSSHKQLLPLSRIHTHPQTRNEPPLSYESSLTFHPISNSSTPFQAPPILKNPPSNIISFTQRNMCQVHRVTNTCGHRNDHVLISCHISKAILESGPNLIPFADINLLARPISQHLLDAMRTKLITIHGGFHACTELYCRQAVVRELASARGFVCMVPGCGTVD